MAVAEVEPDGVRLDNGMRLKNQELPGHRDLRQLPGPTSSVVVAPDSANISQFQRQCLNASCVTLRGVGNVSAQALLLESPLHVLALPCGSAGVEEEILARLHAPYDADRRWSRCALYSADSILPDQQVVCRITVEGSDRVALFHDSSTVHIGWHQGGLLYVYGSLCQAQESRYCEILTFFALKP